MKSEGERGKGGSRRERNSKDFEQQKFSRKIKKADPLSIW